MIRLYIYIFRGICPTFDSLLTILTGQILALKFNSSTIKLLKDNTLLKVGPSEVNVED